MFGPLEGRVPIKDTPMQVKTRHTTIMKECNKCESTMCYLGNLVLIYKYLNGHWTYGLLWMIIILANPLLNLFYGTNFQYDSNCGLSHS